MNRAKQSQGLCESVVAYKSRILSGYLFILAYDIIVKEIWRHTKIFKIPHHVLLKILK